MPDLSIKNVPEQVVEKLRQRAASHHRSLQGELMDLICRSTDENSLGNTQEENTQEKDNDSSGWLTIDELAAELLTSQPKSPRRVPLAVDIIRQERDSR